MQPPRAKSLFPFDFKLGGRLGAGVWLPPLLVVLSSFCGHADTPDFSGSWELDVARSDFGPVPGPSRSTLVVDHKEPVLLLTTDSEGFRGENHVELEFVTDGTEKVQTINGKPRTTRSYWESEVLVTEWEIDSPGQPRFEMVDRRWLSDDGQTMRVDRKVLSSWAEWEQEVVYTRTPPGQAGAATGGH